MDDAGEDNLKSEDARNEPNESSSRNEPTVDGRSGNQDLRHPENESNTLAGGHQNEPNIDSTVGDNHPYHPENETKALADEDLMNETLRDMLGEDYENDNNELAMNEPENLGGPNEPNVDVGGLGDHLHRPENEINASADEDQMLDRNLAADLILNDNTMDVENTAPDWVQLASDHYDLLKFIEERTSGKDLQNDENKVARKEPKKLSGRNEPNVDGGLGDRSSHHPEIETKASADWDQMPNCNLVVDLSHNNDDRMDVENSTPDRTHLPASEQDNSQERHGQLDGEPSQSGISRSSTPLLIVIGQENMALDHMDLPKGHVDPVPDGQQVDEGGTLQIPRTELQAQVVNYQHNFLQFPEINEEYDLSQFLQDADEIVTLDITEEDERLGTLAATPAWWEEGTDSVVKNVQSAEPPNWFDEPAGPSTKRPNSFEPVGPSMKTPNWFGPPAGPSDELPPLADTNIATLDFGEEDDGQQTPDWLAPPNVVVEVMRQETGTPDWFAPPEEIVPPRPPHSFPRPPPFSANTNVQSKRRDTTTRVKIPRVVGESGRKMTQAEEEARKEQKLMYPLPEQSLLLDLPLYNTYHHHHVHQMKLGTFDDRGSRSTCEDPGYHIHTSCHKVVLVETRLYTLHPTSSLPHYFEENNVEILVASQEPATYSIAVVKPNLIEFVHHIVHTHDVHINHANYKEHFSVPSIWTQTCTRTMTQGRHFGKVGEFLHNHFHEHIHSILIRPASFQGEPDEVGKFRFLKVTRFNVLDGTIIQLGDHVDEMVK